MPCYSIQASSVELAPSTDPKLLTKALESLGYRVSVSGTALQFANAQGTEGGSFEAGTLTFGTSTQRAKLDQLNAIKRAYSTEVVKAASARFGWTAKQSSPTQFQVTRRI